MPDPKDPIASSRESDNYGIGQMDDGRIDVMTPDEAAAAVGERDAYDEAFDDEDEFEEDLDDVSDLDDEGEDE